MAEAAAQQLVDCVCCGATGTVSQSLERQEVPCGDADQVAVCTVPVMRCGACGMEWTDCRAEPIRMEAVCRLLGVPLPEQVVRRRQASMQPPAEYAASCGLTPLQLQAVEGGKCVLGPEQAAGIAAHTFGPAGERLAAHLEAEQSQLGHLFLGPEADLSTPQGREELAAMVLAAMQAVKNGEATDVDLSI